MTPRTPEHEWADRVGRRPRHRLEPHGLLHAIECHLDCDRSCDRVQRVALDRDGDDLLIRHSDVQPSAQAHEGPRTRGSKPAVGTTGGRRAALRHLAASFASDGRTLLTSHCDTIVSWPPSAVVPVIVTRTRSWRLARAGPSSCTTVASRYTMRRRSVRTAAVRCPPVSVVGAAEKRLDRLGPEVHLLLPSVVRRRRRCETHDDERAHEPEQSLPPNLHPSSSAVPPFCALTPRGSCRIDGDVIEMM